MTPRPDASRPRSHARHDEAVRRRTGSDQDLLRGLRRLDGRNYGAYKSVLGDWDYGDFTLSVDRIQSDPYAPPSSLRALTTPTAMGLPEDCLSSGDQRLAAADYLLRSFGRALREHSPANAVQAARPGQEILQRSACTVRPDRVELRFQVHLPARGRTILGDAAARLFDLDVPNALMTAFDLVSDDDATRARLEELRAHVRAYEDHRALQQALADNGWVAFVADGSLLARRTGVSPLPLPLDAGAVPFEAPESLRRSVTLPHAGEVTGMAVEPGVTVIVGGGYHGKSTLLSAVQQGVYAHVPGDGRELVATLPDAVKVRAADGRAVTGVDVSPFIAHLPGGADTTRFSTSNASGSTSQAAAIVEAVELGAPLLLLDEDTSATNLLIRDARMRSLVRAEKEPITPLVDRVGSLAREGRVSTIMVMGGSGDYLDVADRVLMLDTYRCLDVTPRAHEVVAAMPRTREDLPWPRSAPAGRDEGGSGAGPAAPRPPERIPVRARGGRDRPKTRSSGLDTVVLDKQTISLADVEQIVDPGQAEAIAWAVRGLVEHFADGRAPLPELLDRLERSFASEGLDACVKFGARPHPAFLVRPRRVDIGAALNRYRTLALV
ncbi:MAG: ABC-ATPase domain-containing protein [Actinomyces sp.]|jgi:predicted ABC-class ATPase|nr:ABC-ATPase domain-containing protein [Actinomyces sp.]MCI1642085.1 ABC-ATPase domain-containing protein [Actinomyces sp.]MCI1661473.1 ABC-ATPase domain-containing protein [Actinomyces sp.]MCI1690863.1 ABC-ATPase domain-containing protein [Actinomyces sp.]